MLFGNSILQCCFSVVHLEEAIALGVTCDTTVAHVSQLLPFCSLERTVSAYCIVW
jgi:hypothetical protein